MKKAGIAGLIVLLGLVVLVILSSLIQSTIFFTYNQKVYTDAYVATVKDIWDNFFPGSDQQDTPVNASQDTTTPQSSDTTETPITSDVIEKQLGYLARLQELQSNSSANGVTAFFQSVVNAVLLGAGGAIIAYISKKAKEATDKAQDAEKAAEGAKNAMTGAEKEKGEVDSIAKKVEEIKDVMHRQLAYMDGKSNEIRSMAIEMNDQLTHARMQNNAITQSINAMTEDITRQQNRYEQQAVIFDSMMNAAMANASIMTLLNPPAEDIWHMQLQWINECIMKMRNVLQGVKASENVSLSAAIQALQATIRCAKQNQSKLGLDTIREQLFQQSINNWEQWVSEIE